MYRIIGIAIVPAITAASAPLRVVWLSRALFMAASPGRWAFTSARLLCLLFSTLVTGGCATGQRSLPTPYEMTAAGAAARVLLPFGRNEQPSGPGVKLGTPRLRPVEPPMNSSSEPEATVYGLSDAIAYAL